MRNFYTRIIPSVCIIWAAFCGCAVLLPAGAFAAGEPQYDIEASFDPVRHRIEAQQRVSFTNNSDQPVRELYFHIYPHRRYSPQEIRFMSRYAGYFKVNPYPEGFQSGDLRILQVSAAQHPLDYSIEGQDQTLLKIILPAALAPGKATEVTLAYQVAIPPCCGRFGWHRQISTLTRWYPMLCVLDKQGWHRYPFYIYHQPFFSEAARYRLKARLPQEYTLVSGCALKTLKRLPDGTQELFLESAAPMRDLGLGISSAFEAVSLEQDGIRINAYYVDGNKEAAGRAARHAAGLIRFHQQRFGPYPYKEFHVVPSYLGFGGDQSSGLIFIDTRFYRLPHFLNRYFDFLVSHETSHQWFYNIVGSDEYREMFMDEGMNSYWVLRYLEHTYGENAGVMDLPPLLRRLVPNFTFRDSMVTRYLYLAKSGYDRPVIGELSSFREPSSIFALAYGKGAAILWMLEKQLGREVFDRIVARYTREFAFRTISVDTFARIAGEEAGQDLSSFFDQWLRTGKQCDFVVKRVGAGEVAIGNKGALEIPVRTRIAYADGSSLVDDWDGRGAVHVIPVAAGKKVVRVDVDAEQAVMLDIDRTNNHWPARKTFKPVPWYFFAYELPVLLPRDSYNAVCGPTVGGAALGAAASVQKPFDALMRISSQYDFNGKAVDSVLGYELSHLGNKQQAAGFEIFDYESSKRGHDVAGGKFYFRKELWPANYGLFGENDHISLYLIRDQKFDTGPGLNGREDIRNQHYRRKDEAILGLAGSLGRFGPYGDPQYGWRFIPVVESAGHFLGGTQAFWRTSAELQRYCVVLERQQHVLAVRGKTGWGAHADKNLFEIGGADGLRGYAGKTLPGARMMLGSAEYRFPLRDELGWYFLDNILRLSKIQGVLFFDAGKAWYSDFSAAAFKKDAGFGMRFHFDLAGPLEKLVVRLDAARALHETREDTRLWVGITQYF